jgi:titin
VISGNDGSGVNLNSAGATGNVIQGNYIGVAANALVAVGNLRDGITLNGTPGNLIGGTNSGARNLISGNGQAGVYINGGSDGNRIEGNYIGTDAAGSSAWGTRSRVSRCLEPRATALEV